MKQGKTLQELATEVDRQAKTKKDYLASCGAMALMPPSYGGAQTLHLDGIDQFEPTDFCHDQIAGYTDIPRSYYQRMRSEAPELLEDNVNHWFKKNSTDTRLVRTLDGKARAFLSKKYRPLDNYDLLEAVLPQLTALECRIESCEVTERKLYLKVVTERLQREVKVGEVVQMGLSISNSEIGQGKCEVAPLIWTLRCLNGMVAQDTRLGKHHVGRNHGDIEDARELFRDETRILDNKAFWAKVTDVVAASLTELTFERIVARLTESTQEKIPGDPVKVMELAQKRFGWTEGERNGVLTHLLGGGDLSKYGLVSAVTRHSQDIADYDRATDFEVLGGKILELPRSEWKTLTEVQ
jgi:hypothetical protein